MYNQEEDPGFNPTPIHILAWGGRQERAAKTSAVVPIGSEAEERELLAAQAAKLSEVRINSFNLLKIKHDCIEGDGTVLHNPRGKRVA